MYAAQSFHWVDPLTGYAKAGRALRPGGALALFWNRTKGVSLQQSLDELYEQRAPGLEELTPEVLIAVEKSIGDSIAATNLFEISLRPGFSWSDRLTTGRYIRLIETYSHYATLPESKRRYLLEGVAECIDAAGGEIDIHYETVIHLARRKRAD